MLYPYFIFMLSSYPVESSFHILMLSLFFFSHFQSNPHFVSSFYLHIFLMPIELAILYPHFIFILSTGLEWVAAVNNYKLEGLMTGDSEFETASQGNEELHKRDTNPP